MTQGEKGDGMEYAVIAEIMSKDGKKVSRYRAININTYEVKDITRGELEELDSDENAHIRNIEIEHFEPGNFFRLEYKHRRGIPRFMQRADGEMELINSDKTPLFVLQEASVCFACAALVICDCYGKVTVIDKSELNALRKSNSYVVWNSKSNSTEIMILGRPEDKVWWNTNNREAKEYLDRCKLLGLQAVAFTSCMTSKEMIAVGRIGGGEWEGELVIPDFITKIACDSFRRQSSLSKLVMGRNVRVIDDHAFWMSIKIELYLNEGLEEIGYAAFEGSVITNRLVIPSTVRRIEFTAFRVCGMPEIEIKRGALADEDSKHAFDWLRYIVKGRDRDCRKLILAEDVAVRIIKYFCMNLKDIQYHIETPLDTGDEYFKLEDQSMEEIFDRQNVNGRNLLTWAREVYEKHKNQSALQVSYGEAEEFIYYLLRHGRYGVGAVEIIH